MSYVNSIGMRLTLIPAGEFLMGGAIRKEMPGPTRNRGIVSASRSPSSSASTQ